MPNGTTSFGSCEGNSNRRRTSYIWVIDRCAFLITFLVVSYITSTCTPWTEIIADVGFSRCGVHCLLPDKTSYWWTPLRTGRNIHHEVVGDCEEEIVCCEELDVVACGRGNDIVVDFNILHLIDDDAFRSTVMDGWLGDLCSGCASEQILHVEGRDLARIILSTILHFHSLQHNLSVFLISTLHISISQDSIAPLLIIPSGYLDASCEVANSGSLINWWRPITLPIVVVLKGRGELDLIGRYRSDGYVLCLGGITERWSNHQLISYTPSNSVLHCHRLCIFHGWRF